MSLLPSAISNAGGMERTEKGGKPPGFIVGAGSTQKEDVCIPCRLSSEANFPAEGTTKKNQKKEWMKCDFV